METLQNPTNTNTATVQDTQSVIPSEEQMLQFRQQQFIDFCAIGGMLTDDDGAMTPTTKTAFAEMIGVSRQTLYDWKKNIPDFNDRVKQARLRLGGGTRLAKVHNGLYLKAASGNPEAVKLYLQIYDGWKPPKQEVEMEHNFGLADLVAKKKLEMEHSRKVIDATPDSGSSETAHS